MNKKSKGRIKTVSAPPLDRMVKQPQKITEREIFNPHFGMVVIKDLSDTGNTQVVTKAGE